MPTSRWQAPQQDRDVSPLEDLEERCGDVGRLVDRRQLCTDRLGEVGCVVRIVGRGDHAQFVEDAGDGDGVGAGRGPAIGHQDGDPPLGTRPIELASGRRERAGQIGSALASKPQQVVDHGQR